MPNWTKEEIEYNRSIVDAVIKRSGLENIVSAYNSAIEINLNELTADYGMNGGYSILYMLIMQVADDTEGLAAHEWLASLEF